MHDEKEHGVILNTVPITADYIIIPDAGSNQVEEQERLSETGRVVLIIDHHKMETQKEIENVIIVNNQDSPEFENKSLSGAGMVYKVIQAYNLKYRDEFPLIYQDYADLAAVGIVSDMMDTRNLDNNYIIYKGLKNIKNPFLQAMLVKQEYSVSSISEPTKIDIAFYIAPLINGTIRYGSAEEKDSIFNAFITYDPQEVIETEYGGEARIESFFQYYARLASNIRGRQNRDKLKCMNFLKERVEEDSLADEQLLIVKVSKDDPITIPKTITGLVAMELLKEYKKPTLVLRPRNIDGKRVWAGSGRGKSNGHFKSLFKMLRESELCNYVEGHDMAHGVEIPEENLPFVIEFANEYLKDIEFDIEEIEVDHIFTTASVNSEIIKAFGKPVHIYGNGIPQPKFAFEVNVAKDAIRIMGAKKNTVKFTIAGVDFLKFHAAQLVEFIENTNAEIIKFKLVGRASINTWMDRESPQIMIDAMEYEAMELQDLF